MPVSDLDPSRLSILALCALCTGCATVTNGTRQPVTVNSTPSGARVLLNGAEVGKTPWVGQVERRQNAQILLAKEGYEEQAIGLHGRLNSAFWIGDGLWLICVLSPFSTTTDLVNGAAYEYDQGMFHVTLEPAHGK